MWDLSQYLRYSGHRSRPYFDLVGQIGHPAPSRVVDLGCGDGSLTATLLERWPEAVVEGVDSSPAMIAGAAGRAVDGRLSFRLQDIRDWRPEEPVDVIVSNATLQWLPEHPDLLPRFVASLSARGWLGFQVPGNDDAPSHALLRELRRSPRWRERTGFDEVDRDRLEPAGYLERLAGLGCVVDAWETTYLHVLQGDDAVLEWVKGTALRPTLARLGDGEREAFLGEYRAQLREVYRPHDWGTVMPFRRIFVVAHKAE